MFVQNEIQKKKNYKPAETQHTYFTKKQLLYAIFCEIRRIKPQKKDIYLTSVIVRQLI